MDLEHELLKVLKYEAYTFSELVVHIASLPRRPPDVYREISSALDALEADKYIINTNPGFVTETFAITFRGLFYLFTLTH